ncbi:unnamed protein product [Cladocopium goreaui]|uniref:Uncharacterized protein n=1 Tax=Cladocopium goreaui TaxID=2562237 RepID=A0A9P1FL03_9DINO|nr:unnamed protein product [Cladocopium goreaui]
MCTRFLYTVLPSELYWGDETLTHINRFFAENLLELFENGILVETRGGQERVYFCVLGVKGDWPYLRKAMGLNCGYNCTRKCHLCNAEEWYDMSTTAPWRSDTPDECPTPFKDLGSPFFILPGLTSPTKICIDAAHTWHIGLPGCSGFTKFIILD